MHKRICISILIILVILSSCLFSQTILHKRAPDVFTIKLNKLTSDSIRILQVTDLHLGHGERLLKDQDTFRRIHNLVTHYHPDMVAITGDCFTGDAVLNDMARAYISELFDRWQCPWLFVFGNHDPEGGRSRDSLFATISRSQWGVLGRHMGNDSVFHYDYRVSVNTSQSPLWEIYGFDTGSEAGTRKIDEEALSWFKRQSQSSRQQAKRIIPAIALFHIPLRQYQALWDDDKLSKLGEGREAVNFEEDDGHAYETFVQQANIRACFCGHDHYNTFYGSFPGNILLAYCHISGASTKHA